MNTKIKKMNSANLPGVLLKNRTYKILSFLTLHPGQSFYDKEVSENTGVSRGATNQVLKSLFAARLVTRQRKGRMWFYSIVPQPLVKQYRIFENLVELSDLTNRLLPYSKRIILFGSVAVGDDTAESDIDLFVITEEKEKASKTIRDFQTERELKPVIQTPLEYATSKKKDKAFYNEVAKGIVLFEKESDE